MLLIFFKYPAGVCRGFKECWLVGPHNPNERRTEIAQPVAELVELLGI